MSGYISPVVVFEYFNVGVDVSPVFVREHFNVSDIKAHRKNVSNITTGALTTVVEEVPL